MTPLHTAAREGNIENVRSLLKEGADVHALDDLGRTALYYAAFARCAEAVTALLAAGSDPNRGDEGGVTPLMAAIGMHVDLGFDYCGPGIHYLSPPDEEVATIKALLQARPDLDQADWAGRTALHYAASKANFEVFDLLFAAGADITLRVGEGETVESLAWGVVDDGQERIAKIAAALKRAMAARTG